METGNLRNEDFRKLLSQKRTIVPSATTQQSTTSSSKPAPTHSFTHKQHSNNKFKKKHTGHTHSKLKKDKPKTQEEEDEEDEANLKEILKNYRDRADERRKKGTDADGDPQLAAAYRAVPGDRRSAWDAAEKRKQTIQESKYLGGDMEHTHLVKGLDYSLLHKVRSEIAKARKSEKDEDDELEETYKAGADAHESVAPLVNEKASDNIMVRNLNRILFNTEFPVRNELFGKGRMAYVVELEEEDGEVPHTLLRSILECPKDSNSAVSANSVLIQKLTQVLSYLRADNKKKKKQEAGMPEEQRVKAANESIYEGEGEYVPKKEKEERRRDEEKKDRNYFDKKDDRDRDRDRDREKERDRDRYDRGDRERDRDRDRRDRDRDHDRKKKDREEDEKKKAAAAEEAKRLEEKLAKRKRETEGYDECYPGFMAEMGGGWESDEEDLSKMDGSRPVVKRWDFDDQEDYEKFQSGREAMPKAAYQFGVKKNDGRKTKNYHQQEKKIDRDLGQINKILERRKNEPDAKRPKY